MAIKSLDEYQQKAQSLGAYQRRQKAGVKSLSDYQQQQQQDIADDKLDPYLGRPIGYRLSEVGVPAAPAPEGLFLDEAGKQFLDDVMDPMYFGEATGRHFEQSDDDKLKAYYSMKLRLPPAWIDQHSDTITEALLGDKLPAKTAGQRIGQYWRNGQIQVARSDLALQVLMGQDSPETWRQLQELQKAYSEDPRATFRPWWEKMLSSTAEILPYSIEGITAAPVGASIGGAAGAAAALTLGQLGPQALAPEESVTVPAAIWSGVKLGGGVATAYRIGQLEAGGALLDLLEMGIDPAIAKAACVGVGALNGALELSQISTLLKTLPGGKKLASTTIRQVVNRMVKENTFRNLATRHAAKFGVYLTAETLQELGQESVNVTAEQLSAVLHEQLKGQDVDTQTLDEIVARFREVGAKSLQGFTVLGIPGSALSAAVEAGETIVMRGAPPMLPNLRETHVNVPAPEPAAKPWTPEDLPVGVPGVQARTAPSVAEAETLAAKGLEAAKPLPEMAPEHAAKPLAETRPGQTTAQTTGPTTRAVPSDDQATYRATTGRTGVPDTTSSREAGPGVTDPDMQHIPTRFTGQEKKPPPGWHNPENALRWTRPPGNYTVSLPAEAIQLGRGHGPRYNAETAFDALAQALASRLGQPSKSDRSEALYFYTENGRSIRLARHPVAYHFADSGITITVGADGDIAIPSSARLKITAIVEAAIDSNRQLPRLDMRVHDWEKVWRETVQWPYIEARNKTVDEELVRSYGDLRDEIRARGIDVEGRSKNDYARAVAYAKYAEAHPVPVFEDWWQSRRAPAPVSRAPTAKVAESTPVQFEGYRLDFTDPRRRVGGIQAALGAGRYVALDPAQLVAEYAVAQTGAEEGRQLDPTEYSVGKEQIRLQNPLVIETLDQLSAVIEAAFPSSVAGELHPYAANPYLLTTRQSNQEVADWAQANGYDGIIIRIAQLPANWRRYLGVDQAVIFTEAAGEKTSARPSEPRMSGPTPVPRTPTANLEAALDQLSMEALVERAKRIGVTVKGKKAQLAALIAETIRAKVVGKQTKTERQALQETERQIAEHPLYREYDERMATTEGIKIDPDTTYYVEPKYKGDVEGYIGKAGAKDYNAAVGRRITFDKAKGQAWDDAVREQGFEFSFDQFMENLIGSISGVRAARTAGLNEAAIAEALRSGEPELIMLDKKRQMLREQRSVWEINQALHAIAADYKLDLADYEQVLIGADMASPAGEVHPGSLSFQEFFEQLGRELVDEQSPWLRRWTIPAVPEKPREMWNRLRSEWQAIKAHEIAGELNIQQAAEAGRKLTREQEAELGKIDAEKVAENILKKHKDTLVGKLIGSMFDDAVEIRQLREALVKAYRAGTKQGIADAREAYRQGQQRIKARRQLREYVAKLLRIIKKPVGKTVAFSQRLAVQMIQQQIDPKFRRLDTIEKRRQSREFFEKHPEAEAPRKTIALIESVAPNELTVAQLETIAKEVSELKRKGRLLRKVEIEARAAKAKADHDAVVGALMGGELPVQTIEPVVAPPVVTMRQKLRDLFRLTLTTERVFDWFDGRKLFHGPIFGLFFNQVADAENVKLRRISERVESARKALADVGMTLADLQQTMFDLQGKELTVQDCLGIYLFRMNPMSKLAVTFGNWISEEVQKRIVDMVESDPRLVNLAQYILQHYEDHYARLREAVILAEDRDMGKEDNYTPMRRMERDYTPDERSILTEMMQREHYKRGVAEKGMTLARKDIEPEYQKPIRLDAWTLLLEQIERQEHYIAFADLTKQLRAIATSDAVTAALRDKHSPQAARWLREYVDVVANPNIYKVWSQAENLARIMRRHTAIAFLAWKLSTALKQTVSLVRYMPEAGHHLLKAGLEAATDWQRVREFVTARDPMVEFAALERELEEIKAARPGAYRDLIHRFGEAGLKGLVWFDAPTRTIGWYGVYLAEHDKAVAEGLDAPEADRRATEAARSATSRTQAGARAFQLPELYRSGEVYNLLLQFTNEMNKLWNIVTYDLPSLVANKQYSRAAMTFAAVGLEAGLIWTITHRRPPEDEDDIKDIALEQIVSLIPVIGNNIVAIERGFGAGTDVAALSGGAEFASNAYKAMEGMLAGEVDAKSLEAAYRGLAPVVGLPYTGPKNLIEFGLTGNPYYLVGGLPTGQQKNPRSKSAVKAKRNRK